MATTKKHARRSRASRRSARALGGGPSQSEGRYPDQSAVGGTDDDDDLGGGPSRHRTQAKHNEGLSGSEGLGSDDQVIDSSFSLSGRKPSRKKKGSKTASDVDSRPERSASSESEPESEEGFDVDIPPRGYRGSDMEGHGRGMAPGAGA